MKGEEGSHYHTSLQHWCLSVKITRTIELYCSAFEQKLANGLVGFGCILHDTRHWFKAAQ